MTVKELAEALYSDELLDGTEEVRIVFHGYTKLSFNIPAASARRGANGNDFIIICEEER